jgi:membrane protease YdiL (CAAX protease family)
VGGTLLTLVVLAAILVIANLGEKHRWARITTIIILGPGTIALMALFGVLVRVSFLMGTTKGPEYRFLQSFVIGAVAGAALGLLYLIPSVQRAVARVIPLRPGSTADYAAVVLALILLLSQLIGQLYGGALSIVAAERPVLTDFISQEALLLILAPIGVGFLVRRSLSQTAERLALRWPKQWWWWLVAIAGIIPAILTVIAIDAVATAVDPATTRQINDVTRTVFASLNNPIAVVVLGISAGVGEEVLFRGALQPRFGLILTALLFTAVHTQYGITSASLEVFLLGIAVGLLRDRAGLPVCIVAHAGYDIAVGMMSLIQH